MPRIYLIRHGQASFMKDNYDQLSTLGIQQSLKLGQYLRERSIQFDHALVGTMQRQIDTMKSCLGDQAGDNFSENSVFNEHEGPAVFKAYFPKAMEKNQPLALKLKEKGIDDPANRKALIKVFYKIHQDWTADLVPSGEHETWAQFRLRIRDQAFKVLEKELQKHDNIVVFSSGGVIATIIGEILGLSDAKIVELNWEIKNTAVSTLKYSNGKWKLHDFNNTAHLQDDEISFV